MVFNGVEIGGASLRIYRPDVQQKVLAIVGIYLEQAEANFSYILEALDMGTPPHDINRNNICSNILKVIRGHGQVAACISFINKTSKTNVGSQSKATEGFSIPNLKVYTSFKGPLNSKPFSGTDAAFHLSLQAKDVPENKDMKADTEI
ncbi:hypothetical protein L1987_65054 [Smallanthus sonchifolius]|uniref:Uncharacterized protein n=1 Tax=Smallanthus sonchifolius TaxID=185202 RepID=A0ACB9BTL4_9ASTR|nr:hypothetical protein L1987_65054 [Smallanthus sonchifolius]